MQSRRSRGSQGPFTSPSRATRPESPTQGCNDEASLSDPPTVASSPPSHSVRAKRIRRPPPITPRRFRRFFTPRGGGTREASPTPSAPPLRALQDVTSSALNNAGRQVARTDPFVAEGQPPLDKISNGRPAKRLKIGHNLSMDLADDYSTHLNPPTIIPTPALNPLNTDSFQTQVLLRSVGNKHTRVRYDFSCPTIDASQKTSNFYSAPEEHYNFGHENFIFSSVGFHSSDLVGFGTSKGDVVIIDASQRVKPFGQHTAVFSAHKTVIYDISVSQDDRKVLTASADRTARITDVETGKAILTSEFWNADCQCRVKCARFQPGDEHVVATVCRNGSVNVWDTRISPRCPAYRHRGLDSESITQGPSTYNIPRLHRTRAHEDLQPRRQQQGLRSQPYRPTRQKEISVTALSFLSGSYSHYFVTGCESSAELRIWDIRSRFYFSQGEEPIPVSVTPIPEMEEGPTHRGICSIVTDTNCTKLYAMCLNSTVYTYATTHLTTGNTAELEWRPRWTTTALGPMYAFRNPMFNTNQFYGKAALRPARNGCEEMLAVASSRECAVLFPTSDHDLHPKYLVEKQVGTEWKKSLPVYDNGTALVNAHARELTTPAFTKSGDLITCGDDFLARCWREGEEARIYRREFEAGGHRQSGGVWAGWADVEEGFDDEEDEEILED